MLNIFCRNIFLTQKSWQKESWPQMIDVAGFVEKLDISWKTVPCGGSKYSPSFNNLFLRRKIFIYANFSESLLDYQKGCICFGEGGHCVCKYLSHISSITVEFLACVRVHVFLVPFIRGRFCFTVYQRRELVIWNISIKMHFKNLRSE